MAVLSLIFLLLFIFLIQYIIWYLPIHTICFLAKYIVARCPAKAPVTHSRFWLRFITIRPDVTYIVKSGCIGMVKTENSEIPTMSHDVPTVSPRIHYDS